MPEETAQPADDSAPEGADANGSKALRQAAFLAAFRETGNVRRACDAAKVHRSAHYRWLDEDDAYAQQFAAAKEDAADLLEDEARRRAVDGLRRLKFQDSAAVIDPATNEPYVEMQYSDTLLIFLLKGVRPEKYRENVDLRHSGHDGGPVKVQADIRADLSMVMASPDLHGAMSKLTDAIEGGVKP